MVIAELIKIYIYSKRAINMKKCKECHEEIINKPKRQLFCSRSCSVTYNNKGRTLSKSTKEKIKNSIISYQKNSKVLVNILEASSRTVSKILNRLDLGCSNCGWKEGSCDLHHIEGRKIKDADNHKNLSLLCPNCHRLVHEGKIKKSSLKTFDKILPINWQDMYYG